MLLISVRVVVVLLLVLFLVRLPLLPLSPLFVVVLSPLLMLAVVVVAPALLQVLVLLMLVRVVPVLQLSVYALRSCPSWFGGGAGTTAAVGSAAAGAADAPPSLISHVAASAVSVFLFFVVTGYGNGETLSVTPARTSSASLCIAQCLVLANSAVPSWALPVSSSPTQLIPVRCCSKSGPSSSATSAPRSRSTGFCVWPTAFCRDVAGVFWLPFTVVLLRSFVCLSRLHNCLSPL